MIKKYKDYIKENLLDKLEGPDENVVLKSNPNNYLEFAVESGSIEKINKALENGADILENDCYIFTFELDDEMVDYIKEKANLPKTADEFISKLFNMNNLKEEIYPGNARYNASDEISYCNDSGIVYIKPKSNNLSIRLSNIIYYILVHVYKFKSRTDIGTSLKKYISQELTTVINSSSIDFDIKKYLKYD